MKRFTFKSIKSELLREKKIQEIDERREKKRLKKMKSLEKLREMNPDIMIDEDTYLGRYRNMESSNFDDFEY